MIFKVIFYIRRLYNKHDIEGNLLHMYVDFTTKMAFKVIYYIELITNMALKVIYYIRRLYNKHGI
jgi:hypothetical protein